MKKIYILLLFISTGNLLKAQNNVQPYGNDILIDTTQVRSNFVIQGSKYTIHNFSYAFVNYTNDLTQSQIQQAISTAFQQWTLATNGYFTFTYTTNTSSANFKIGFYTGNHGDGSSNAFDGVGGVLAHSGYPPPAGGSIAGQLHFDDAETWTVNGTGIDLQAVAMHEIGHILGLAHSGCSTAAMWSSYVPQRRTLDVDDIKGIRTAYNLGDVDNLISGSNSICGTVTNSTYIVDLSTIRYSNLAWSYSSNLSYVNYPSSTSIQIRPNSTNSFATLKTTVTSCSASIVIAKQIGLGAPAPTVSVTLDCPDGQAIARNDVGAQSFTWHLVDVNTHEETINSNYGAVKNYHDLIGTHNIGAEYTNGCGTSPAGVVYNVYCSGSSGHIITASPNPTTGSTVVAVLRNKGTTALNSKISKPESTILPLVINRIQVFNGTGLLVKTFDFKVNNSSKQKIDLNYLQTGLYQLIVTTNDGEFIEKVQIIGR